MEGLDKIDLKLLRILQHDSNITTKELAAKVNLSSTPVFERVRRLEKEGYIQRYVALLDAEKLDKNLCILCNVKLKQHNGTLGREFMAAINAIPEVTECYNISGELRLYAQNLCARHEAL